MQILILLILILNVISPSLRSISLTQIFMLKMFSRIFSLHSSMSILRRHTLETKINFIKPSYRNVAGSMPALGITSLCPWKRHNFLTGTLCVVDNQKKCLFYYGIYREKKLIFPKVSLGNNCFVR